VAVAGYTNLSRDHLDYHGTMAAYGDAKAILFRELSERAAICVDDAFGCELAREFRGPRLTLATAISPDGGRARAADGAKADVALSAPRLGLRGSEADLHTPDGRVRRLVTPLVGAHNLQNAALAVTMAHLAGLAWEEGLAGLAVAPGAPGRLERCVGPEAGPAVFVDYAHTPDALGRVLATVRAVAAGPEASRLVCVFGAGGDRDRGKRPEMAREAACHADRVVLTSDNPRSEDPEAILDDLAAGLPPAAEAVRVTDRRAAIHTAIREARTSDVVVIAGKGHEDYQIVGAARLPFDDRAVAAEALAARGEVRP
jgi:UDP-N-acetylmuramoyl-L-alanyl-D-glutamate--2,6-diaminopimelate ligase